MFENLSELPPDSILGLSQLFRDDPNAHKIDLGVGVYRDEAGRTPILKAVVEAEKELMGQEGTKAYLPPIGAPGYGDAITGLVLSESHPARADGRVQAVQSVGGCGALRLAADLIKAGPGDGTVWVSDPTWPNHQPLLSAAGLPIKTYPYYERSSGGILFDQMMDGLAGAARGDVVLLHGCCHNPTGADLAPEQWQVVGELAEKNGFLILVDIAYQGLATDIDTDGRLIRDLAARLPEMLVAVSFSKNFGLYRERAGALMVMAENATQTSAAVSHCLSLARQSYSMPPAHGALVVNTILQSENLTQMWKAELAQMTARINDMRKLLADTMAAQSPDTDLSAVTRQKGMFSILDLSPEQVAQMRSEHSVYLVGSGRINLCGLTTENVGRFCEAYAQVI